MDKLKKRIQENIHKMDVDEPSAAAWDGVKRGLSKPEEIDPLKIYIAENNNRLEIETPDAQSWEEISRFISAKKSTSIPRIKRSLIYLSAACILTIISLGMFRYMNDVQINPNNEIAKKSSVKNSVHINDTINTESTKKQLTAAPFLPDKSLKQNIKHKRIAVASLTPAKKQKRELLPPVLMQIEKDYGQLIASQIAYTKSLAVYGENAGYFQEFMNDFKTLEKQEKQLRRAIAEYGLRENSIDELTMLYQQKLTVLKKLQHEINKTTKCNKNLTDTIPVYIKL